MAGRVTGRCDDCHTAVTKYVIVAFEFGCRMFWLEATDAERARMTEEAAALDNPPLISVLLPVYNIAERYLRLAIDSVLR